MNDVPDRKLDGLKALTINLLSLLIVALPFSWLVNEIFRTVVPKLFIMSTKNEWYLWGEWISVVIRQSGYFLSVLPLVVFSFWGSKLAWKLTCAVVLITFSVVQFVALSLSGNYDNPIQLLYSKSYLWMYFYIVLSALVVLLLKRVTTAIKAK
jgi:hypothetical protein